MIRSGPIARATRMKRTAIKRKTPLVAGSLRGLKNSDLPEGVTLRKPELKRTSDLSRVKKLPPRRSKPRRTLAVRDADWLSVVHQVPCVRCGNPNSQAAHRNIGKGMGMKTDDAATAALCMSCHYAVDNGNVLTREERRTMMDGWIVDTLIALVRAGKVGVI